MRVLQRGEGFCLKPVSVENRSGLPRSTAGVGQPSSCSPSGLYRPEGKFPTKETAQVKLKGLSQPWQATSTCQHCGGTGMRCVGHWPWGNGYEVCCCQRAKTPA